MTRRRGFTLIEMAIVLVMIGLLISGGLTVAASFASRSKIAETNEKLDKIQKAITLYAIRTSGPGNTNSCIPCPASGSLISGSGDDGYANTDLGFEYLNTPADAGHPPCAATAAVCVSASGVVPWKDLGLQEQDGLDAWGKRIRYVVSANMHRNGDMVRTSPYPQGALTVNVAGTANATTTEAAYVLVSTGPDMAMALSPFSATPTGNRYSQSGNDGQFENSDNDTTFADGLLDASNGNTHFDDIVRWMSAPMIIANCGANACGNPSN
jgi:prepilin-type N-terminal cleavage/methylation domain-containing protein